jgi:Uma2 family endonuclease
MSAACEVAMHGIQGVEKYSVQPPASQEIAPQPRDPHRFFHYRRGGYTGVTSAHPQPRPLTEEEYLTLDRAAQFRSEFFQGVMYAMSGGSRAHALINSALTRELGNQLKGRPCFVVTQCLRVRTERGGLYAYPDIAIVCGNDYYADDQKDVLLNPTVIVEVLSPSTEGYDRGLKSEQYRKIASLKEYALVSQDKAHIEIYSRQAGDQWLLTEYSGLEATCRFESVDCTIPLAELYDKITFGSAS